MAKDGGEPEDFAVVGAALVFMEEAVIDQSSLVIRNGQNAPIVMPAQASIQEVVVTRTECALDSRVKPGNDGE